MKLEVPYSPELARGLLVGGGRIDSGGADGVRDGFGCRPVRGFISRTPSRRRGVCAIKRAVADRRLQADGDSQGDGGGDTDVHHGKRDGAYP